MSAYNLQLVCRMHFASSGRNTCTGDYNNDDGDDDDENVQGCRCGACQQEAEDCCQSPQDKALHTISLLSVLYRKDKPRHLTEKCIHTSSVQLSGSIRIVARTASPAARPPKTRQPIRSCCLSI